MSAEFDFIARLQRLCPVRPPVVVGIGDDAAVLQHGESLEVVTTDMLMEGVDFLVDETTPELMGRKCLAVNLSDLAAMGSRPTAAFVSVSLPRRRGRIFAERFFEGLLALAEEFQVTIAGGDTNSWDGPLVCSVTALGTPCGRAPVLRSGAVPGDVVMLTGACGGSLSGRHLTFAPRLREAAKLVELVDVHAMIDISDGLAADVHHILRASRVGAILDAAAIPIHSDVQQMPPDKAPLERALSDGEDFELAFTVSADAAATLQRTWREPTPLSIIGQITADSECRLREPGGALRSLPPMGWTYRLDAEDSSL